ncbi:MAG TPA: hypothetical protein DCE78_07995 [Bacteroidetes bacterium]|nr:hypothetical protein [Bacteroidota bacterium]
MDNNPQHRIGTCPFKVIRVICVLVLLILAVQTQYVFGQPVPADPVPPQPVPVDTIPKKPDPVLPGQTDSLRNRFAIPDSTQRGQIRIDSTRARNQPKEFILKFPIYPLNAPKAMQSTVIQTDSTLRWNQWFEYSELLSRSNGVISHRLGGFNRNDFHLIDGRLPLNQSIYIEGMLSYDPVTGNNKSAFIPLERISEITQSGTGLNLRTNVNLQKYYTRKPLTRVSYEQTAFELRNTDGHVSQMVNQQTGFDVVFQGKNNEGEYPRTQTFSRQLSGRVFRHLNEKYVAQAMVVYNGAEQQESDGYSITDLVAFNFSRFFASPVRSDANSRIRSTQFQVSLLRRGGSRESIAKSDSLGSSDSLMTERGDSTVTKPSLFAESRLVFYYDRYRRNYASFQDSSQYRWQSLHLSGVHQLNTKWIQAQVEINGRYYLTDNDYSYTLDYGNWAVFDGGLAANFTPMRGVSVPVDIRSSNRSDGYSGFESTAGIELHPIRAIKLFGSISSGSTMPTMQSLYWIGSLRGNRELKSAPFSRVSVGFEVGNRDKGLSAGLKGYQTKFDRFTIVQFDSSFTQLSNIGQIGGDASILLNTHNWEIGLSSTAHLYTNELDGSGGGNALTDETVRIWNRASIHWKGYVLKRAAFIKTGFYGILSPMAYHTPEYIPVADVWNMAGNTDPIPGFFRLDYDLSARIRNLMVLVRWENVADGLGQFGYYETAPYPMPSRRLRFGLRVIFSN